MRPRVFVSSVVKGFEEYREAARQGIQDAGGEPVLVNEDFPALASSSRNACLDGVDSCDIYIVIIGERGGWKAPSGKLVVEEEYEQARKHKKRVLAFVQDVDRDDDAQHLVKILSDYIDGMFRPTFKTVEELRNQVAQALGRLISVYNIPKTEASMLQEKLNERFQIPNESRLRFVLAPERDEEVIDIISLESEDLKRLLYEIGHSPDVDLFSYEKPKSTKVQIDSLIITQDESSAGHRQSRRFVRLEISSGGVITIDTNITGRVIRGSAQLHGFYESSVIVEADVTDCLRSSFAFVNAFYNKRDPHKRYDRFLYNAALSEVGDRKLVAEFKERNTISFANNKARLVPAFDHPKIISRDDLANGNSEINAALTMFRRRLKE